MSKVIDCRPIREERKKALISYISSLKGENEAVPRLAIVQVGDRPDSTAFIKAKMKFAVEIGAETISHHAEETISQKDLIDLVLKLSSDKQIHGIIVQLPLPLHINKDTVIDAIDPRKDVDGLTSHNTKGLWEEKENTIIAATARGILEIFDHEGIDIEGEHVVMIGRSSLVGKPIALACLGRGASVTVCHTQTKNLADITRTADIIIVAIGKPRFINKDYVRPGQIVIDVGISPMLDKSTWMMTPVGDVDAESIKDIVGAYTPVPYGVGLMTVTALFENLIDAHKRQYGKL